jgi:hypothetical protein
MTEEMSRRTMLKAATAAAGAALAGGWSVAAGAWPANASASASGRCRVGATVNPLAYQKGTTWDQAMADFKADVGRNFEVAKRYFRGASTWPTATNIGVQIQSLIDRRCRGLLCFKPAIDGSDLDTLVASLKAIKRAGLTDAKITLYQEQGLGDGLTAAQFKRVYADYQPVRHIFPLFVDFAGSAEDTWAAYRPAGVDGIAVDYYASAWVRGRRIDTLAQWANQAGQELGIWEIGNTADPSLPTAAQVRSYFGYMSGLQSRRLSHGHLVGDMAWYNGPHNGGYLNTISGTKLTPRYLEDRRLLDALFDAFNGAA